MARPVPVWEGDELVIYTKRITHRKSGKVLLAPAYGLKAFRLVIGRR